MPAGVASDTSTATDATIGQQADGPGVGGKVGLAREIASAEGEGFRCFV